MTGLLGRLVYHVYRSMFLVGDTGLKKIHVAFRLLIAAIIFVSFSLGGLYTIFALFFTYAVGLAGLGREWATSVLILTSIPSLWLSLSNYALYHLGIFQEFTLHRLLWIFLRTLTLGSAVTLVFNMLNITEIYNFFIRVGLNRFATLPLLIWRIIPFSLMNTVESLAISKIKGESIRKRIAPALASILEVGDLVYESSYYKLTCRPKRKIPTRGK